MARLSRKLKRLTSSIKYEELTSSKKDSRCRSRGNGEEDEETNQIVVYEDKNHI